MEGSCLTKLNLQKYFNPSWIVRDYYEDVEVKALEAELISLPQNCLNKQVAEEENCMSKIMICDAMKHKVKDALIQQCGKTLANLCEKTDNDSFSLALGHVSIVLSLLRELNIHDERLIEVALNLMRRSVSFLSKSIEDTKINIIYPQLLLSFDIWFTFLKESLWSVDLKHTGIVEVFAKAKESIWNFCLEIKATLNQENRSQEKNRSVNLGLDSDEETNESSGEYENRIVAPDEFDMDDDYLEGVNMIKMALVKSMSIFGYSLGLHRSSEDELEEFDALVDELNALSNPEPLTQDDVIKASMECLEAFAQSLQGLDLEAFSCLQRILQGIAKLTMINKEQFDPFIMKSLMILLSKSINHLSEEKMPEDEELQSRWNADRKNALRFALVSHT